MDNLKFQALLTTTRCLIKNEKKTQTPQKIHIIKEPYSFKDFHYLLIITYNNYYYVGQTFVAELFSCIFLTVIFYMAKRSIIGAVI